jgi:Trk-type K+ transport system membrane component
LLLMGLALMGGGVATTAGGVKLLRVYALYKHGAREMERLVHPHPRWRRGALGAAHPARGRLYRVDLLHALRPVDGGGDAGAGGDRASASSPRWS